MQFGVVIPHFGRTAQPGAVEAIARAADDFGFDSAWASDHIIVPVGEEHVPAFYYEPFPVMAAAVAVTTRIRIGVSVLVLPYRHPVTVAKSLATLDQMSGGRIILAAGVGGLEREFQALGANFHRRGAISDEYLDVMRACWTQDPIDFSGRWIHLEQMRALPKPVQTPFPVWVGGTSAAAIRRAALRGDGWHPYAIGLDRFAAGVEQYRAACTEAGRPPGVISLRATRSDLREAGGGRAPFSGEADQILEDVDRWAAAGLDHAVFWFAVRSVEELLTEMERVARGVLPTARHLST
jgi:probable F420-dependent oxidoreductase